MSIEEVSMLFDTGRKGDAEAAVLHLHGKYTENEHIEVITSK